MSQRARNWLTPLAWVAGTTAALLLLFPLGFPNYDTIYALLWGREMAEGMRPDMSAPLAPTPHPLTELIGLVATPLGDGAVDLTMVLAYAVLGLIGFFVYRLGALWFDRPVGAVAALIVLTRAPFLSNGLRAYIDLPYIALCLAALLVETRRPRAGWPVLALLALAGLLRPEAWLFSIAYLAYLLLAPLEASTSTGAATGPEKSSHRPGREGERRVSLERADTQSAGLIRPALVRARDTLFSSQGVALVVLTVSAPVAWALFDWLTATDPLYSWTGTKETVETLERQTGPVDLVLYGPRRLGEVLQWPGMIGAAGGVALGLAFLRRRAALGVVAAALALLAFATLACGGLAILPRYTMLAAAILAVFAALGLLGWRLLEGDHPWRRRWQAFAVLVLALFLIWAPNQYDLLHRVDVDLSGQSEAESDLHALADSGAFAIPPCGPIAVPNHRAVPRLAFDLDLRPRQFVSASERGVPRRGYLLVPASPDVVESFVLDPGDPTRIALTAPPGFHEIARNRSWALYRRC